MRFNGEMDDLLLEGASQHTILSKAKEKGFIDMAHAGINWVVKGQTTLDEVSRVVDLTELL
ncbi:hypothetical protein THIOSC15_3000004 [uncultured Thiomicrorhabdus sp.]